jgi:hypothetical protein
MSTPTLPQDSQTTHDLFDLAATIGTYRRIGGTSRVRSTPGSEKGTQNHQSTLSDDKVNNHKKTPQTNHRIINLEEEDVTVCPINLDEGEVIDIEELEWELEKDIFEFSNAGRRKIDVSHPESPKRNPEIKDPFRKVDVALSWGLCLHPGDAVELSNGRFLEIKDVVENKWTHDVSLRGWELRRNKDLGGELIKRLNEVCYIFQVDLDDPRTMREQSVIEVHPSNVTKVRELIRTNYQFPAYRFDETELPYDESGLNQWHIKHLEGLVVRWQYITTFRTGNDRLCNATLPRNYQSRKLVRLSDEECDDGCSVPAFVQRYQWRGDASGGSERRESRERGRDIHAATRSSTNKKNSVCIDISDDEDKRPSGARDPEVWIQVASGDFKTVEPSAFMENIRRKFDAQVGLQHKPQRKTDVRPKAAVHQYSYADACKFLITLEEEPD